MTGPFFYPYSTKYHAPYEEGGGRGGGEHSLPARKQKRFPFNVKTLLRASMTPPLRKGRLGGVVEHSLPARKQKKVSTQRENPSACHIVPDYRTFIEDYLKIVEFIEWLKEYYPEKATFLTKKS